MGWVTFQGDSIAVSLPDSFEGGALGSPEFEELRERMQTAGYDIQQGSAWEQMLGLSGTELFIGKLPGTYSYAAFVFASKEQAYGTPLDRFASMTMGVVAGSVGMTGVEIDTKWVSDTRVRSRAGGLLDVDGKGYSAQAVFIEAGSLVCTSLVHVRDKWR